MFIEIQYTLLQDKRLNNLCKRSLNTRKKLQFRFNTLGNCHIRRPVIRTFSGELFAAKEHYCFATPSLLIA